MTVSIPFAKPDTTSTSTAYTVQVDGITELRDGVCFYLMNDRVTSASGFTVNVNNLGAKRVYLTTSAATRATTQMAKDYTWLLVYNETRYSSGCWDLVYTYNTNTTYTLNHLLDGSPWYVQHTLYRYQLMFQVDEKTVTPFNANSNATGTTKTIHTDYEFDPFGKIFYYTTTSTISANTTVGASYCAFVRAAVDLRYTFNVSTSVNPLSLDYSPVYLKININSTTGMATLNSDLPLTQTLPATNDGIYYLYLGRSTSTKYTCSLEAHHPIYYHDGTTLCELPNPYQQNTLSNYLSKDEYEDDEEVIAAALNDLNDRTQELETDISTIDKVTASSLNDLNDRLNDIEEMTSVTWAELVNLRDNSQLKPGRQYRITDYQTTTIAPNTRSAGHQFDVIVTADSINELNENARAILHANDDYFSGDTIYYDNNNQSYYTKQSKLNAWKLKYRLDNDTQHFTWAGNGTYLMIDDSGSTIVLGRNSEYDMTYSNVNYYGWQVVSGYQMGGISEVYTTTETPTSSTTLYSYPGESAIENTFTVTNVSGKGVIYYMEDENRNIANYDFKNIQFLKHYDIETNPDYDYHYPSFKSNGSQTCWMYYLSIVIYNSSTNDPIKTCADASVYGYNSHAYPGSGTFDNVTTLEGLEEFVNGGGYAFVINLNNAVVCCDMDLNDALYSPGISKTFIDAYWTSVDTDNVTNDTSTVHSSRFASWQEVNSKQNAADRSQSITKTSTQEQYPSSWAVYQFANTWKVTSYPSNGFRPNVFYVLGTVTGTKTWALASPDDNNIMNHYFWTFETGSTAPTITWPSGLTWPGGSPPAILPNKHYEISVLNNIVAWMEV